MPASENRHTKHGEFCVFDFFVVELIISAFELIQEFQHEQYGHNVSFLGTSKLLIHDELH